VHFAWHEWFSCKAKECPLLWALVVVHPQKWKFYVKKLHQKVCCMCSLDSFPHSNNLITLTCGPEGLITMGAAQTGLVEYIWKATQAAAKWGMHDPGPRPDVFYSQSWFWKGRKTGVPSQVEINCMITEVGGANVEYNINLTCLN